jgi:hypothetical protein
LASDFQARTSGLTVEAEPTGAGGYAKRVAAIARIERHWPGFEHLTLIADKSYCTSDFLAKLRRVGVTSHMAATSKGSGHASGGCPLAYASGYLKMHRDLRLLSGDAGIHPSSRLGNATKAVEMHPHDVACAACAAVPGQSDELFAGVSVRDDAHCIHPLRL